MDHIAGSSRARQLVDHFWYEHGIPGESYGGYRIPDLVQEGKRMLRLTGYNRRPDTLLYIIGGMPDLTTRLREGRGANRYEEVIFNEDVEEVVDRVAEQYRRASREIKSMNVTPVFATISPIHLRSWNLMRLAQRKTVRLYHAENYRHMQTQHELCVQMINRHISAINDENGLQTPRLAKHVLQKRGKNKNYRFRSDRFEDGCHPSQDLVERWVRELQECMDVNRIRISALMGRGESF